MPQRFAELVNALDLLDVARAVVAQTLDGTLQLGRQVRVRQAHDRHAYRPHRAVAVKRPGQVLQRQRLAVLVQEFESLLRVRHYFRAALAGEHEQFTIPGLLQPGRFIGSGVLLENGVRVDAAESKSVHTRAPRRLGRSVYPGPRLGGDVEIRAFELQLGVRILANRRRQHFVVQRQRGFDQTCHARGGHRVADHGFHRAQRAARRLGPARQEHAPQRFDLHHIAYRRAGAVRFEQPDR